MNIIYKIFFPILLLLLVFIGFIHPTQDLSLDLGEHLLRGKVMVETHHIITTNLFSYSNPQFTDISYEWLTEIIFYFIYTIFGINGLILFTAIISTFAFSIIYFYALKRFNKFLVSFSALLYIRLLFERTLVQPEIFSYLFFSLFIVLLFSFREKYSKKIFLLLPIQLLWVNMHIFFLVGIYLVGIFLLESIILFRKKNNKKYIYTLAIIFVSIVLVSLVNPYGFKGLFFPFTLPQSYGFNVEENNNIFQIINSHPGTIEYSILFFQIGSVMLILSMLLYLFKSRLIDWLISISFISAATVAIRNFPLFVFLTFISFTFMFDTYLKLFDSLFKKYHRCSFYVNRLLVIILFILIGYHLYLVPHVQGFGFGSDHRGEAAVNFIINNHIQGTILNDYDFGSYLAFRLYPNEKVFVDARPEVYPVSFFHNIYYPMLQNYKIFQKTDKKYHFNVIFFSISDQTPGAFIFIKSLLSNNNWKLVYLDQYAIIFLKNTSSNKSIINTNEVTQNAYHLPVLKTVDDFNNLGFFLSQIGWTQQAIIVYKKMNAIDPTNCAVLHNLVYLLSQNGTDVSNYIYQFNSYCQK